MKDAAWVDRTLYPFEHHELDVGRGRMHYVDEGSGPPVLLVHGTPTWSFLWRRLIPELARHHRVIAPDHLGFGLSDPAADGAYRPADHASNLAELIRALDLRDVALVVHDFGGPIGLSYAIDHPDNVRGLVLFNTWMWSLQDVRAARMASRLAAGPLGRFLYRRLNVSARFLIRTVMGDASKLDPAAHRHYIDAFPTRHHREAPWTLARELTGSSDWYAGLWSRRQRIAHLPALLLWGMKDPTFKPDDLERWHSVFATADVATYPDAGHFVQEEADDLGQRILTFLDTLRATAP